MLTNDCFPTPCAYRHAANECQISRKSTLILDSTSALTAAMLVHMCIVVLSRKLHARVARTVRHSHGRAAHRYRTTAVVYIVNRSCWHGRGGCYIISLSVVALRHGSCSLCDEDCGCLSWRRGGSLKISGSSIADCSLGDRLHAARNRGVLCDDLLNGCRLRCGRHHAGVSLDDGLRCVRHQTCICYRWPGRCECLRKCCCE